MNVKQLINALEQYPHKQHEVLSADGFVIEEIGTMVIDALPSELHRQNDKWIEFEQCVLIENYRPHPFWKIPPLIQDRMIRDSWCRLSFWNKIKVLFFGKDLPIVHEDLRIRGIKAIYQQQYIDEQRKIAQENKMTDNEQH